MTAVPVLQRILAEAGLGSTPAGRFALTQSLITDIVVWACLALVIAVSTTSDILGTIVWAGLLAITGVCSRFVFALSRVRQASRAHRMIVLGGVLLAVAIVAKSLDESPLLSGLILGLILPRSEPVSAALDELSRFNLQWLFPLFFVAVGVSLGMTDATVEPALPMWIWVLVLAFAFVIKWVGSWAGGRIAGIGQLESSSAASLLSVRGATELALAAALAEAALLSTEGLRVFVAFAIVSTVVATVLVMAQAVTRQRRRARDVPVPSTSESYA